MGGCFSDVKGGKQGVGGTLPSHSGTTPTATETTTGYNDAVDLFYRTRGVFPLFTRLEEHIEFDKIEMYFPGFELGHNDILQLHRIHLVNTLHCVVQLSLSASKLRDRDITSKSDPMAVVYLKKNDGNLEELGRTEVIMNNLDPSWIKKVTVAYQFEIVQHLVFRIYDVDTKYHNLSVKMLQLSNQDFLGEATCVLSEIVTKQSRTLTVNLQNKEGRGRPGSLGTLSIHAEETVASKNAVELVFHCEHLDNKDIFSKSDPFLRISRIVETGDLIPICKTEVVNNNLNPTWRPVSLTMQQFGSKENPLVIECFDFNSSGNHQLIGKMQKSVADLEKLHTEKVGSNFTFPSSAHQSNEKVLKGQLFVERFSEKKVYSFVDYISSGFELNFMVAVDFTASNGNPRSPDSLHYIDPSGGLNAYQQAIMEVGEVIQFYDSDRRFPAWGFGGRLLDGTVSHCFNLSGNPAGFEVEGVGGIMAAYANALHTVPLAGPTLFGQVINKAAELVSHSLSNNHPKYFVLLIITDGIVSDLQETKDALVRASDLPFSILIVGVGNEDFKEMEILDADNGKRLESSTGRVATRDIVQFVPMREVHDGQLSAVQALLEELPGQFLTFMRSRDIKPRSAGTASSTA
ncbi:C2 domain [Dillenia turbinata]|uniref:C2 domain n=1 Tax=Dillenia turbinata TaxID=194707 RepID=A0AAN8YVR7_9MAGN